MKAIWKGRILAESNAPEVLQGNYYFPEEDVISAYLRANGQTEEDHFRGTIEYYDIVCDNEVLENGAWTIVSSTSRSSNLRGFVAFSEPVSLEN
jgi:uncharacterized protein (DUF427 family)